MVRKMKKEHMQHHYKNGSVGFGVTNKFWDTVFDTKVTAENMKQNRDWYINQILTINPIYYFIWLALWTLNSRVQKNDNIEQLL